MGGIWVALLFVLGVGAAASREKPFMVLVGGIVGSFITLLVASPYLLASYAYMYPSSWGSWIMVVIAFIGSLVRLRFSVSGLDFILVLIQTAAIGWVTSQEVAF